MDRLIEQAYQKTKSTDSAVIMEMVYDLLKKEEAETTEEIAPAQLAKKADHKEISGLVDDTQW